MGEGGMRMTLEVVDVSSAEHAKELCDAYIHSMQRDVKEPSRPALVKERVTTVDDDEEEEEKATARPARGRKPKEATPAKAARKRPAALLEDDDEEAEAEEVVEEEQAEAPAPKKRRSLEDVLDEPAPKKSNFAPREYKKTRDEVRAEARAFVQAKGGGDEGANALADLLEERYGEGIYAIKNVPEDKLGDCYAALLHFKNISTK